MEKLLTAGWWKTMPMDIINMYLAMILYYILISPYPVIILIFVTILYLLIGIIIFLSRAILKLIIQVIQQCLYLFTKFIPPLQNICSKADSILNSFGIWLEGTHSKHNQNGKKRILVMKLYFLVIILSCVFFVVPYYLEPKLTGNSQKTCANINNFVEQKTAKAQEFVDQHYTPMTQEEIPQEETVEHIIFHLGPKGIEGSNLRSSPEKTSGNIVGIVRGEIELIFENEIQQTENIIWVKVSTADYIGVWISSNLLNEEEVAAYLTVEN